MCSLAVLWQGQPRLGLSATLLFLPATNLSCFQRDSHPLLPHRCKVWRFWAEWMPPPRPLELIYTVKKGFPNGFSLSPCPGFSPPILETCGLMLRFKSLSAEKCVMESGHPMNTLNRVRDAFRAWFCPPRGPVTVVRLYLGPAR